MVCSRKYVGILRKRILYSHYSILNPKFVKFKYNARTQGGELQTGFVEGVTREAAAAILQSHDLFILSLELLDRDPWYTPFFRFVNRVKLVDVMVLTRQFATLLESEIPLNDALKSLETYTKNIILKEVLRDMGVDVASGLSLSQAMDRHPNVFSGFYVSMIQSAEITGRLDKSMIFLADYLEKEVRWRARIVNAMIYPALLLVVFLGVAIIMTVFVFPQLRPIFAESKSDIPLLTTMLLGGTDFIIEWWWVILIALGVFVASFTEYYKTDEGKAVVSDLLMRLPIFGDLFKKIYIARFSEATNVLIKGGIPIAQAVEISGHTIGNVIYREILHEISDGVRGGTPLSSLLLHNEYYFPPLVGQMVAVGESTGRIDELLARVSIFYTRETEDMLDKLVELIQPIVLLVVGLFVGLLFAAILLPIFNLAQGFK